MKALKWIGIGLGGAAVVAAAIVALAFTLTAGAARASDDFLALVGKGRYEEAYNSAAPQFRAQTNLETFRATMQRFALDRFETASWSSREISGGHAKVTGTIRTRDGRAVIATVTLVKNGQAWQVYGMNLRSGGTS